MKDLSQLDVELLSLRFEQITESLSNANAQFISHEIDERTLEGQTPPGIDQQTWAKFQGRLQFLKAEIGSFARYCGLKVVIDRRG